jgi:hypothetical protein
LRLLEVLIVGGKIRFHGADRLLWLSLDTPSDQRKKDRYGARLLQKRIIPLRVCWAGIVQDEKPDRLAVTLVFVILLEGFPHILETTRRDSEQQIGIVYKRNPPNLYRPSPYR